METWAAPTPDRNRCIVGRLFVFLFLSMFATSASAESNLWCVANQGQAYMSMSSDACSGGRLGRVSLELSPGGRVVGFALFDFHFFNSENPIAYPLKLSFTGKSLGFIKKVGVFSNGGNSISCDGGIAKRAFGQDRSPFVFWKDVECLEPERIWSITVLNHPLNGYPSDVLTALNEGELQVLTSGVLTCAKFEIDCGGVGCDYELCSSTKEVGEKELQALNTSRGIKKYFGNEKRSASELLRLKKELLQQGVLLRYYPSLD